MSSIADWAYVNPLTGEDFKVKCRKFIRYGDNGKAVYGDIFEIRCYFTNKREVLVSQDGVEFTSSMMYLTDYQGIKELDLVGSRTVRLVELLNSTPFGETVMDWRIWT